MGLQERATFCRIETEKNLEKMSTLERIALIPEDTNHRDYRIEKYKTFTNFPSDIKAQANPPREVNNSAKEQE